MTSMSMSRLPAELLYFVIYNPQLKPSGLPGQDDEDAEEHAHVLFYTAKNHAVSKDRVLRQVGLAKAMANFTTLFDARAACDTVHSAGRRMLMVSPEANFWFHACFELEKNARTHRKDTKGKAVKGKEVESVYDANESSLHDKAMRARLLMGYDAFKLTHGLLSTILENVGREALELQLERFFTVWAWNWNLEKVEPFTEYLGPRIHPLSNQLVPLLDTFEDKLPLHYYCITLVGSCIIGSRGIPPECPKSLVRHCIHLLQTRLRAEAQSRNDLASLGHGKAPIMNQDSSAKQIRNPSKSFLGVPMLSVNATVNAMDVRKWTWPESLTFGIGGPSNEKMKVTVQNDEFDEATVSQPRTDPQAKPDHPISLPEIPVDTQSLADALSSSSIPQSPRDLNIVAEDRGSTVAPLAKRSSSHNSSRKDGESFTRSTKDASDNVRIDLLTSPPFSETYLHLDGTHATYTRRRLIRYLTKGNVLLAVIPSQAKESDELDDSICKSLEEKGASLIDQLMTIVNEEEQKIATAFASSPVQNVFQKSQHVISTSDNFTISSSNFNASSWHLHEGKQVLDVDDSVLEVYSRGQSPQDWHLSRRVGDRAGGQDYVFMEIGRKEASLIDVEGEICGVLRRFAQ